MKKLAWTILAWLLLSSFTIAVINAVIADEEVGITIKIRKTDLDRATKYCYSNSISVGQVAVFDAKGRHFSLPCSSILDNQSGK